ncbi:MAG: cation diffusion facilitator family transporter [Proteobacteria bacterium]|nr:cation diffusion facilitator family transporter [Pseudomonadota bacterium]MBU2228521.1 cation diffusion facilitator family transporter [Pseudomonadota bacterium]MBU2262928.1 cation diffusion facilitator family transporter [Pseudomonadota bacterium]
MDVQSRKMRVAGLSVISNAALVASKLAVGLLIGSVSIMSEAIHSGVDLLAAVIAVFSVRTSSLPADARHSFGHGKIENISGTVEALLIFAASGWIIFEAIRKILHPQPIAYVGWGVVIMFISAAVNYAVSGMLFKVGRETDSIALQADGWHLRTDVYTSVGVMASLSLIWIGNRFFPGPNLDWLDPAAALGVSVLIIHAAYRLTIQSARDLMDVRLPPEEETWILDLIRAYRPVIHGFHKLRTRKAGNFRFIEFHIKVDPEMSVKVSHRITDELSESIKRHFSKASVTIHIEPCGGRCDESCLPGCLLEEEKRGGSIWGSRVGTL